MLKSAAFRPKRTPFFQRKQEVDLLEVLTFTAVIFSNLSSNTGVSRQHVFAFQIKPLIKSFFSNFHRNENGASSVRDPLTHTYGSREKKCQMNTRIVVVPSG